MIQARSILRDVAQRIAHAAEGAMDDLVRSRVEHEPQFTDRMLGRIQQAMSDYESKGVRWTAKTLTSNIRDSQEYRFGADFIGFLDIALPDYSVRKGFLAQAKRLTPDDPFRSRDHAKLVGQCEQMLALSPASFVFLYSPTGIRIAPALSVKAASRQNPHGLYTRAVVSFFELHLSSFVGDSRIYAADIRALEELRDGFAARTAIHLAARHVGRSPERRVLE